MRTAVTDHFSPTLLSLRWYSLSKSFPALRDSTNPLHVSGKNIATPPLSPDHRHEQENKRHRSRIVAIPFSPTIAGKGDETLCPLVSVSHLPALDQFADVEEAYVRFAQESFRALEPQENLPQFLGQSATNQLLGGLNLRFAR